MKRAHALLTWHLFVECPYCESDIDLTDFDEGQISVPLFNNRWDELNGMEVECPTCQNKFALSKIEY